MLGSSYITHTNVSGTVKGHVCRRVLLRTDCKLAVLRYLATIRQLFEHVPSGFGWFSPTEDADGTHHILNPLTQWKCAACLWVGACLAWRPHEGLMWILLSLGMKGCFLFVAVLKHQRKEGGCVTWTVWRARLRQLPDALFTTQTFLSELSTRVSLKVPYIMGCLAHPLC